MLGGVLCGLVAGSDTDISGSIASPTGALMIANNVVHEFAAAGSVDFKCLATVGGIVATQVKITAIRVGNLTNTG